MTNARLRPAIILAVALGLLAVPTLNVMRGFAGLSDPPLVDVAAVFLAAAALALLASPSAPMSRAIIASAMAFFMNAALMTIWYSADGEAQAWVVWILGLPASLLLGALVGIGSWLEVLRASHRQP